MIDFDYQEKLLTTKEAAELLRVSVNTIRAWVRQGRIRGLKLGRQLYFRYEDLGVFMMNEYLLAPFDSNWRLTWNLGGAKRRDGLWLKSR